jgi:acetate kinase
VQFGAEAGRDAHHLTSDSSRVSAWRIATDEEWVISRHTASALAG